MYQCAPAINSLCYIDHILQVHVGSILKHSIYAKCPYGCLLAHKVRFLELVRLFQICNKTHRLEIWVAKKSRVVTEVKIF